MNNLRKDALDLMTVTQKIQSAALNGDHFSDDEILLIRQCATELLEKLPSPSDMWPKGLNEQRDGYGDEVQEANG